MKNMLRALFALFVVFIIYQFIVNFFITKKDVSYTINGKNNTYMIYENYNRNKNYDLYSFLITDKNKTEFVYDVSINLNRQSRIIKDVISFKKNSLYCIAPVFKNNYIENIVCKYNNELTTYNYLKQLGNNTVDLFIEQLNKTNYKVNNDYQNINIAKTKFNNISYYSDIDKKLYFVMWSYKGIYIINGEDTKEVNLLSKDMYDNDYGRMIGRYYLFYDNTGDKNGFYKVDIKTGNSLSIESNYELSNNIYINGIYKNKLYFTDLINQKQYILDPNNEDIKLVEKGKYYDGKSLRTVDTDYLITENRYFVEKPNNDEITKRYGDDVVEGSNSYFIKDNAVYKVVGSNYDYKVKLFTFSNISNLKVLNNNIYFINDDVIYMYNNKVGIKKVVENRELIYNHKNIYDVYEG